ncbi:tetratricopeptide repeat protein [Sanyastnella coralliicola]|uniref:tetratricopeptide repeat protein n=1 Tax=Sanyastnella coralliicola TaxID=3069118 RepID=UPI0027B933B9|nr:tetratricopeptide repeat protein [Longitalea sp. SCSIO 12813]
MRHKLVIFALLLFCSPLLNAQNSCQPSRELISEGIELYDNGNYLDALNKFKQVHPSDTAANTAIYEQGLSLLALERYEESLDLFKSLITPDYDSRDQALINLATAYDGLDQKDSALHYYDIAISDFPYNYNAYFNRAITLMSMERGDEAVADLKMAISMNPNHSSSHYYLGLLAATEGKLTQALMSWSIFLFLEPDTQRSNSVIQLMDQMAGGTWDVEPEGVTLSAKGEDNFKELDLIIDQRVALDKKYKFPYKKIDIDVTRQVYLLFKEVKYDKGDKGFWMQTYVPIMEMIRNQNKIEDALYTQMVTVGRFESTVKKKFPAIRSFVEWYYKEFTTSLTRRVFPTTDGDKEVDVVYYNSGLVYGAVTLKNGILVGDAEFYTTSGGLMSKGSYDSSGNQTGLWKFYNTSGTISREVNLKDGSWHGKFISYNPNGTYGVIGNMDMDALDGLVIYYSENGAKTAEVSFEQGKQNGPLTTYYYSGGKKMEAILVDGAKNGEVTRFYPDGQISEKGEWKDDFFNGKVIAYFPDGSVMSEGSYIEGELDGEYVSYHPNGEVHTKAKYSEGVLIGKSETFYMNGSIASRTINDEEKNLTGTYYEFDFDGNEVSTNEFKKDEVVAYTEKDQAGNILAEGKKKGGKFLFEGYRGDGIKTSEGYYKPGDEGKTGTWKFYNENGILSSEIDYDDNAVDGRYVTYFMDGTKSYEATYVNDEPDGEVKWYHRNGNLKRVGSYSNGIECGAWYEYYPDGKTVEGEYYYSDGVIRGWKKTYDANGVLSSMRHVDGDALLGIKYFDSEGKEYFSFKTEEGEYSITVPWPNGEKQAELHYTNFLLNGTQTWYYPDGQISAQGEYLNGDVHGPWKKYHFNGQLSQEGTYVLGDRTGVWKNYHSNGKVSDKDIYLNGVQIDRTVSYYDNGKKSTDIELFEGEYHGVAKYYAYDGTLQMVRKYYNGNFYAVGSADANGNGTDFVDVENETGDFETKFANGKTSRVYAVNQGLFQGPYIKYFPNGQLQEEQVYLDDERDGQFKKYYPSGKLKYACDYTKGVRDGKEVWYYENGKLKRERTWQNDEISGEEVYYDSKGNPEQTVIWRATIIIDIQ